MFLDVGGLGFTDNLISENIYPKNDNELVEKYYNCIVNLSNKYKFKDIIIAGVSYGGKLSILLANKINDDICKNNLHIKRLMDITPVYDPYYSMAFIPTSCNKIIRF